METFSATSLLSKLVSFPVLGGQSNLSIIYWIKEYIESFGIVVTLVPDQTGTKASLHCRIGPAVDGGIILSGHTDVVPVEGQDWETDPFELTEKEDGRLYGRGAADMKGFLACCLFSLPKLVKATLKKPIYFAFSYDEEIGCLAGPELAAHIRSHYRERPKFAIIGEPSLLQPVIGQKGICVMKTILNGSAGHSSRIRQEVSAIHESARLILWLEAKMNEWVEAGRIDSRFNPPHSSIHVGQIKSGIAPNVIADKAIFYWDIRVIPMDDANDIIESFRAHCRERENALKKVFPGFKIEVVEDHSPVPPLDTDPDDEIVGIIGEITGNHNWSTVAYAAEAGQFAQAGFQSIICGPGDIAQAHRPNEYIEKVQLEKGVKMIENLVSYLSS